MSLYSSKQIFATHKVVTILLLCAFALSPFPMHTAHAEEPVHVETTEIAEDTAATEAVEAAPANEEDQEEEETAPASIDTGDAVAESYVSTQTNTNETTLEEPAVEETTEEESTGEEAELAGEETEEIADESTESSETSAGEEIEGVSGVESATEETNDNGHDGYETDASLIVTNNNEATTTTEALSTAETGQNNTSGSGGSIDTGDAVAVAQVVNVVNTNIVNSDGLLTFINDTLGYSDFDMRDTFDSIYTETANSTSPCSLETCSDGSVDLTINNENDATIENNISVTASTGGNSATGDGARIHTGSAYAHADILNVANTNITDSNYLLLVFNNNDALGGNLILPSSAFFREQFTGGHVYGDTEVHNTNTASITNNVTTLADTGGNSATGDAALINTGNAYAQSSTQNVVNTNLFGGSSFSMLVRVHGDWDGEIFGLPEGMSWTQSAEGIKLIYEPVGSGQSGTFDDVSVHNTNRANITNNVEVYALTGDNQAEGDDTNITTGNASAGASIYNLANTNIIGQNWANLIFNIYGNWDGNISFGVPDLWIGAEAYSEDSPILPESEITYTFTITNNGDTDAPNTILHTHATPGQLSYRNAHRTSATLTQYTGEWDLGLLRAGESREVKVVTTADPNLPRFDKTEVPLTAIVTSDTPDANDADNEEFINISVGKSRDVSEQRKTFRSRFSIEKTASADTIRPGETVDYSVNLFSHGGPLFDAMLIDVLADEEGTILQEQKWPLGTIDTWEDITIDYSIAFSPDTATGTYTNRAQLLGYHKSRRASNQSFYESELVMHELEVTDTPTPRVLGVSSCEQYIHTFMRQGAQNDSQEVIRLQTFLNGFEKADITINGVFDSPTAAAVYAFQRKYASDILSPWGASAPTGYVYLTTRKKINELYCAGTQFFPLSSQQQLQIDTYRNSQQKRPYNTVGSVEEVQPLAIKQEEEVKVVSGTPAPSNDSTIKIVSPVENVGSHGRNNFLQLLRSRLGSWLGAVAEAADK